MSDYKILMEKVSLDPMENSYSRAISWNIVGYVDSQEEAEKIILSGKTYTPKDCWAIEFTSSKTLREYRSRIIIKVDFEFFMKKNHEST